jgi:hypothetical protein
MGLPMKRTQASVDYTDHGTYREHCSLCVHFLPPHQCTGVAGHIEPGGYCIRFKREKTDGRE